jgi:hypothetical protein
MQDYRTLTKTTPSSTLLHELGHTLDVIHPTLRSGRYAGYLASELAAESVSASRQGMNKAEVTMAALQRLKIIYPRIAQDLHTYEDVEKAFSKMTGQQIPDFLQFLADY